MKTLNLFPIYRELIQNEEKNTTIRLGDKRDIFLPEDQVNISVGWDLNSVEVLKKGVIQSVSVKKINEITHTDVQGESPDCQSVEAVKYVLGSIYKRLVEDDTIISIIKWRYF